MIKTEPQNGSYKAARNPARLSGGDITRVFMRDGNRSLTVRGYFFVVADLYCVPRPAFPMKRFEMDAYDLVF